MASTQAVQHSKTSTLPKEAELGDSFFIEHRSSSPLSDWQPFSTIWLCTGHARVLLTAEWRLVQMGEEQEGEIDLKNYPYPVVQHSRIAELPKNADIFSVILINHVSNSSLGWIPFCTFWVCTGHLRFENIAKWQPVQMGEEQLGEADGIQDVQNSRTAKLPKNSKIGDNHSIKHVNHDPLTGFPTFMDFWLCTGHDRLTSFAQWQQVQLGEEQLGE